MAYCLQHRVQKSVSKPEPATLSPSRRTRLHVEFHDHLHHVLHDLRRRDAALCSGILHGLGLHHR
jgi:hypothetical protein